MTITKTDGEIVIVCDPDEEMDDLVYAMDCAALNAQTLITTQRTSTDNYRNLLRRIKIMGKIINDFYMKGLDEPRGAFNEHTRF